MFLHCKKYFNVEKYNVLELENIHEPHPNYPRLEKAQLIIRNLRNLYVFSRFKGTFTKTNFLLLPLILENTF